MTSNDKARGDSLGGSLDDRLAQTVIAVNRAQAGQGDALEQLITSHLTDMRAFVRLQLDERLRRREAESDIVQSACREILSGLSKFEYRGPGSFRAWLFTAVLNKVREKGKFHRAQRRDIEREVHARRDDGSGLYDSICRPDPTASQIAQGRELEQIIEAALDRLTSEQREVLILNRLAGLSHAEISERLEISSTASRSLLARARVAMLAALEER